MMMVLPRRGHETLKRSYTRYLVGNVREFLSLHREDGRLARLVAGALAQDRPALLACFASPVAGVAIRCYGRRDGWPGFEGRIDAAFAACAPRLLLELAYRRLLAGGVIDWVEGAPTLTLMAPGIVVTAPPAARGWRFEDGLLTVLVERGAGPSLRLDSMGLARGRKPVQGLRSELGYVSLEGPLNLALWDDNPIAAVEAHPEKGGNVLDLGGHSEEDWRAALSTALLWIREIWPALFEEMQLLLRQIVPVGYDAKRHLSASYREAIGTVYMSLHPDPLVMADALIHEFQHNKMNLLSYENDILRNAHHPLFPSPVRPDPRPLWGVLMAVHAFLPVAVFHRKLKQKRHAASRAPDFEQRLKEIDRMNHEGMETLSRHGDFTPLGRGVFDELQDVEALAARGAEA